MYRFLVKPKWLLLHLVCIAMVIIMINLGFWQLHRLHDRQAFNERVRQQSELVPIPLADALSPATGNPAPAPRHTDSPPAESAIRSPSGAGEPAGKALISVTSR